VLLVILNLSCIEKEKPADCGLSSFELNQKGDTINLTYCGLKQGKWVPTSSNNLKDTVYYRNDTLLE
jgi:hypothetical protein